MKILVQVGTTRGWTARGLPPTALIGNVEKQTFTQKISTLAKKLGSQSGNEFKNRGQTQNFSSVALKTESQQAFYY